MMTKFGEIPQIQWDNYKLSLAKAIFLPLPFYEDNYGKIDQYFDSLLLQIYGLNEILNQDEKVISILVLLEGAKLELSKEDFNLTRYRKAILDAYNLAKQIGGE